MQFTHKAEADRIIIEVIACSKQGSPVVGNLLNVLELLTFLDEARFLFEHFINGRLCALDPGGQDCLLSRQRRKHHRWIRDALQ